MNPWWYVLIGLVELAVIVVLLCGFHERGWRRGYKAGDQAGYDRGRIEADNWWIGVEQGTQEFRDSNALKKGWWV